jgi:cobalamin biosynthesis protein CobD/CbiB
MILWAVNRVVVFYLYWAVNRVVVFYLYWAVNRVVVFYCTRYLQLYGHSQPCSRQTQEIYSSY